MRSLAVAGCLVVASVSAVFAQQKQWTDPRPPCSIEPGHFRVNSGVLDLKLAAEKPEQRDRMLHQAQDVLLRAIRDDRQDKNPAAWYYLGRYYTEVADPVGADSAFDRAEALVPQCRADIGGYRVQLAEDLVNRGLVAWQGGRSDSAVVLLRQAYALDPSRPKPLFQLGSLYIDRNELDSATAVLRQATQAAGSDTAYADAKREALLTVARLAFRGTQANPDIQRWQHTRYSRDSILPSIANDSTIVARVQQSWASRRARGARLSPADQQAFARDSAAREQSLARGRAALAALQLQAAADSAAAQPAFATAIVAYQEFVNAYPTNIEATTTLAAMYSQSGRVAEAGSAFDGLLAHSTEISTSDLYDLGQRLVAARMFDSGIKAYSLALEKNPYHRNALAEVAKVFLSVKDGANAVSATQRLVALDPLNKSAVRLLSQAWDLRGRQDSAQKYGSLADTLSTEILVASLVADSSAVTLTGIASNPGSAASHAFRITVEFLDARGAVQGSQSVEIPGLPPGGSQQFSARVAGRGVVGWRYRAS